MIGVPQLSANDVPGLPFPCRPTFSAAVVPKRP
jgi:hypothetical protein